MKKGQSLIEFAVILMSVTIVAIIALQIINNKINSSTNQMYTDEETSDEQNMSSEEADCRKMGLTWDKQNGLCEAN